MVKMVPMLVEPSLLADMPNEFVITRWSCMMAHVPSKRKSEEVGNSERHSGAGAAVPAVQFSINKAKHSVMPLVQQSGIILMLR